MRKLLPIVIVAAVAAMTVLWFWPPTPTPTPTPAPAPKVAAAPAPVPVKIAAPALSKVEMPKLVPPVVPPAAKPMDAPPVAEAAPAPGGVQAELNATIDDIATMMQAGDFVGMFEKYAPPEEVAKMSPQDKAEMEQAMQQETSSPEVQQMMQGMTQMFQSMKDQTPEMNATGDQATYQMTPTADMLPPGMALPPPRPMTFEKVDGRWYLKRGEGF